MAATSMLVNRLKVDVSPDGTAWTPVTGVYSVAPVITPVTAKRIPYVKGWGGSLVLSEDWALTLGYKMRINVAARDAGQVLVEACVGQHLVHAQIWVRWYDRTGLPEARQGFASVAVAPAADAAQSIARFVATFTGDGELTEIANPLA